MLAPPPGSYLGVVIRTLSKGTRRGRDYDDMHFFLAAHESFRNPMTVGVYLGTFFSMLYYVLLILGTIHIMVSIVAKDMSKEHVTYYIVSFT